MSSEIQGDEVDLSAITGRDGARSGVAAGEVLIELVEAAARRQPEALEPARRAVIDELGTPALIRAAGVIGNFERMTRIADASGIPLDTTVQVLSRDFQVELGLDRFGSARNSKAPALLTRLAAPLLRRIVPHLLPRLAKARSKRA